MIRALKYLALFLWIIGAGALYGLHGAYGLPHMIWSYKFWDNGDPHNPFAERHYTSCTFIGFYGSFTVDAVDGRCGWVRLFKEQGE